MIYQLNCIYGDIQKAGRSEIITHDIQRRLFQMWVKDYQETGQILTAKLGNKLCLIIFVWHILHYSL